MTTSDTPAGIQNDQSVMVVRRPPALTDECWTQIETALRIGDSVVGACEVAGISRDTYYRWRREFPPFADMVGAACSGVRHRLLNVVNDVTNGSTDDRVRLHGATWMLERRFQSEFGKDGAKYTGEDVRRLLATVDAAWAKVVAPHLAQGSPTVDALTSRAREEAERMTEGR